MGVRFFGVKAVTAVVPEEKARKIKVLADVTGRVDWFVGEDGHEDVRMCGVDCFQGLNHAGVDVRVIEFMDPVVVEKKCECFGYILLIG